MSRFKIGQRVVAVIDHRQGFFKKGDEFVVGGFSCCPQCGLPCVYLKNFYKIANSVCNKGCSYREEGVRECYAERNFAPIQSFGEQIAEQITKEVEEVISSSL